MVVGDDGCLGWRIVALVHFSPLLPSFVLMTNDLSASVIIENMSVAKSLCLPHVRVWLFTRK